jgi:hypothetical protein
LNRHVRTLQFRQIFDFFADVCVLLAQGVEVTIVLDQFAHGLFVFREPRNNAASLNHDRPPKVVRLFGYFSIPPRPQPANLTGGALQIAPLRASRITVGYLFPRDAEAFAALVEHAAESRISTGIHYRSDTSHRYARHG